MLNCFKDYNSLSLNYLEKMEVNDEIIIDIKLNNLQ